MMMNIAVIPARAGSKSIQNKNLKRLRGKSITHIAIESALDAGFFDQIILSTDIPVLIEEFSGHPKITVKERARDLATDEAKMSESVYPLIQDIPGKAWLWLLQPTSPFRQKGDYIEIQKILDATNVNSLISVKSVASHHPSRMYTIGKQGQLHPILGALANFENKQNLNDVYIRNGCFYVVRVGAFRMNRSWFVSPCYPYAMPEERSVNIDGPVDLILAEALCSHLH